MTAAIPDPPHNADLEVNLLNAVMGGVAPPRDLEPAHFYNADHGAIFGACLELASHGAPVNVDTVADELERASSLAQVGGRLRLREITRELPDTNVEHYAGRIVEDWIDRQTRKVGAELVNGGNAAASLARLQHLARSKVARGLKSESLSDICAAEYPEPRWAVPGLFPEGFAMFCGKPKIGKSWLLLDLTLATGGGGYFLGNAKVDAGEVLYFALEDSRRRIKSRTEALLGYGARVPANCHLLFEAPRLGEGLEDYLCDWMARRPDTRAILIDTLARVRPRSASRRKDWYLEDTEQLAPLQRIALDQGVMILAAGHLRKSGSDDPVDLISGSSGLTGIADTIAVLTRSRGRADGELFITGRDIEEQTLAMVKEGHRWILKGNAEEYRMSETRAGIAELLRVAGEEGMHYEEVAGALKMTVPNAKMTLGRMVEDGQAIRAGGGRYLRPTVTCYRVTNVPEITEETTDTPVTKVTEVTHFPLSLDLWPKGARGRVLELERMGMKRAAAMQKVRQEVTQL